MNKRIAKLRALSWPERRLLCGSMLLLPLFWVGLRVFGLPRLRGWLDGPVRIERPSLGRDDIKVMGTLVNIAGAHAPWPSTCLTRSLLLGWLLRRRGVRSELRIGVRLDEGRLEAHAWVEYEGRPINDADDVAARFAPFDEALAPGMFA
jgi:hypothetical protein